jgi:hypothetical protein
LFPRRHPDGDIAAFFGWIGPQGFAPKESAAHFQLKSNRQARF